MTSCGSCSCAKKHEVNGNIKRHWCDIKNKWMLSDAQRCQAPDSTVQALPPSSSDVPFCPIHPEQHLYFDASVMGGVYCPICKVWMHIDESGKVSLAGGI